MFRRKTKSKSSFLSFSSFHRGSDIVRPENTSLVVNGSPTDGLSREITSISSENDHFNDTVRKSSSLMKSLSSRKQSTPLSQSPRERRVLRENNSQKQKKNLSLTDNRPASQSDITYFEEVLKECGATPLPENGSFLMSEDQAAFSIKLNNMLKESSEIVKKFFNSFEEKSKDSKYLQKMLIHTLTAERCEVARGPVQDPLLRMLLNVSCLQADLVELLLKEIARLVLENKSESENVQVVGSILRQMRFLPQRDVKIASKLLEIIHVSTVNVQREIIFLLPEVILKEEAEETCLQLVDMLKFNLPLTNVIIDALTNLPLNEDLRSQLCVKVLNRLDKCSLEHLPSLVQFILNKCNGNEILQVINGMRKNLPFTSQHDQVRKLENLKNEKSSEENSFVKLTFENLKFFLMASKQATEAWLKLISASDSTADFSCVDLAILIVLYSCLSSRKSQILQLLRIKVKADVLTEVQVENMFQFLLIFAVEYFSAILEIASASLKSFEGKLSYFGALLYKHCFRHFHFHKKQTVISEIFLHVGTGSPGTVNAALSLLKELCESEKESLSRHSTSMSGLLVKVPDLELTQVRLMADMLAELAFSESCNDGTCRDELQIFIQKQLISSKVEQWKKGIVAAVALGKHAGRESGAEEVNALLEMAMGSRMSSEIKRGFFNDEFATMMKESRVKKSFLEIWRKKSLSFVLEYLMVRNVDVEGGDFPTCLRYPLGDQEENFAFPAVDFAFRKSEAQTSDIVPLGVIPSTFRLLWCVGGDPSKFLPAFCASVILPDVNFESLETFDDLEQKQAKKILDSLFLCSNYLVECVNAFCVHEYYERALLRVKQLIAVRKLIANYIRRVFGYLPPLCQFYAPVKKVTIKKKNTEKKQKRGQKRKLDDISAETSVGYCVESEQIHGTAEAVMGSEGNPGEATELDLSTFTGYFREIHWHIHKLLESDLAPLTTNADDISLDEAALETSDVLFILDDLTHKSEQILKSTEVPFRINSTTSMQNPNPDDFIDASIRILPSLLDKLQQFSAYSEAMLQSNDWVYDARGLYSEEANDVKLALASGLKYLGEIISWRGFRNSNNKLKELFLILSRKTNPERNSLSKCLSVLASDGAKYLATFGRTVLVLSGALSIVKSFQICLRYAPSQSSEGLAELCHDLLCRNWYTVKGKPERGSIYNQQVDFLLKTYFSSVEDKVEAVKSAAKIVMAEVGGLATKDSEMKTFKTIRKSNFPLLYRAMCEALVSGSSVTFSKNETDHQHQLNSWNKVLETLLTLVEIAKSHSSRAILSSLLKHSQSIIQLFLSKGISVVESALKLKSVEVLSLLKWLQITTRFLHSICCHSRITNDSVVAAHVPVIRSQCERLTFEVKGMLISNQMPMDCITIAILKNRDLKGNDIISQETLDESDDDSELPPEDTPDSEEMPDEDMEEVAESYSENY